LDDHVVDLCSPTSSSMWPLRTVLSTAWSLASGTAVDVADLEDQSGSRFRRCPTCKHAIRSGTTPVPARGLVGR
jgi:hypothetical protein